MHPVSKFLDIRIEGGLTPLESLLHGFFEFRHFVIDNVTCASHVLMGGRVVRGMACLQEV